MIEKVESEGKAMEGKELSGAKVIRYEEGRRYTWQDVDRARFGGFEVQRGFDGRWELTDHSGWPVAWTAGEAMRVLAMAVN